MDETINRSVERPSLKGAPLMEYLRPSHYLPSRPDGERRFTDFVSAGAKYAAHAIGGTSIIVGAVAAPILMWNATAGEGPNRTAEVIANIFYTPMAVEAGGMIAGLAGVTTGGAIGSAIGTVTGIVKKII